MNGAPPVYGLWLLVVVNSAIFIFFALTFAKPASRRDWRSMGAFSAFVVALFAEMYGFPLTIYLLSGWLQSRFPETDLLSHDAGHLWTTLIGWEGNPHFSPIHLLSYAFIFGGFLLLSRAWEVLHEAQRNGTLAMTGPYSRVRHPQYAAFVAILLGFLLQWPTLLTLAMFPVLAVMYTRLARNEERKLRREFGALYDGYAARVPAFIPRWRPLPADPGHATDVPAGNGEKAGAGGGSREFHPK